jgi:hypothetical protein
LPTYIIVLLVTKALYLKTEVRIVLYYLSYIGVKIGYNVRPFSVSPSLMSPTILLLPRPRKVGRR